MPDLNDSDSSENMSEEMEEEQDSDVEMSDADSDDVKDEDASSDDDDTEKSQEVTHRTIYVQFPRKRPENAEEELRKVSDKVKYVRFPRQKKARFCFVHCDTETDAVDVEKKLRSMEICGMKVFVNRQRKIDDPEFRQKLKAKQIEKKIAKRDAKRLKKQLKQKAVKKVAKVNKIVVSNIPDTASVESLREIFNTSVDFQYREKPNRIAFVTFSTTEEATKFIKKHPKVGEKELSVRPMLIVNRKKKQLRRKGKKPSQVVDKEKKKDEKPVVMKEVAREVKKDKTVKSGAEKMKTQNKFMKKGKSSNSKTNINYVALKKALG